MTLHAKQQRRIVVAAVIALGLINLALSATATPFIHVGILGFNYAIAAVSGAHYVLFAAGLCALLITRSLLHGKRTAWWTALAISLVSLPSFHIKDNDFAGMVAAITV